MAGRKIPLRDPKERLLAEIGRIAARLARQKIQSETLRSSLSVELRPNSDEVVVGVPHYWAVYYHDGRGPIRAKPGRWLVYFKDPALDPRIKRGYPVRASDIVRLTRDQFYDALARDELIVTKSVGPAGPHPFFSKGMSSLQDKLGGAASRFMRDILADVPGVGQKIRDRAPGTLK